MREMHVFHNLNNDVDINAPFGPFILNGLEGDFVLYILLYRGRLERAVIGNKLLRELDKECETFL